MSARALRVVLFLAVATLSFVPSHLLAQGTIRGTVTDASGSPAPGAAVHINGTLLGGIVDSTGRYRITRVPAGPYIVRITKLGFAPDSASVVVSNGGNVVHDARLRPATEFLGNVVVLSLIHI